MGVKKDTQEVIMAQDFSCLAQMLEEYICFGAVQIILPHSSPEIATLDEMPPLLKNRIRIINDDRETETVNRLLFELRREFDVKINEETNYLKFPKGTQKQLIESIDQVHSDVKKLALGFNHKIQININPAFSIDSLATLRAKVQNANSRIILAQIEALLNQYEKVEIETLSTPKENTPYELISIFDKLINDEHYLQYSDSITQLSSPFDRDIALIRIRELIRIISAKNYIGSGWDYITKIIKVWTGVPLPESKAIATLINGNELPAFVNMDMARKRAVELWRNSNFTNNPLRRDGLPIADDNITWLPPLDGMKIRSNDNKSFSLGTVGELLKALQKAQKEFDK